MSERKLHSVGGDDTQPPGDVPSALPDPPEWLSDEARALWDRLAPVVPAGNLTVANAELFAMFCTSLATYAEADGIINAAGLLITAGQDLIPSPALQIRTQADGLAGRWAKTFGLTPDAAPAKPARGGGMRHLREA